MATSAACLNTLQEAFTPAKMKTPTESKENPQAYDQPWYAFDHVKAARPVLGLVGGNEASGIQGNRVDLESDLFGITRPITWGNSREHQPPRMADAAITRVNAKGKLDINIRPVHLPTYQMWAYPATLAPEPFKNEACQQPHKF